MLRVSCLGLRTPRFRFRNRTVALVALQLANTLHRGRSARVIRVSSTPLLE